MPIGEFDRAADHGLAFCAAIMGTDLRHTPVVGGEEGYPDLIAKPDLSTLTLLPWEPGVACCIADLHPAEGNDHVPADPRGAVRRAVAGVRGARLQPDRRPRARVLPVRADEAATNGVRRYVDNLSMVYTVGPQADPKGVVRQITEALSRLGMHTFAANHEFMNSQYEINLRHAPALTAADRAFRLKSAVKDVAAMHGLIATFMGKPFNDQGGSGFHIHFSLDREDDNAFADHDDADGVSAELRHFSAGVLAHARGADRVPEPDDQRLPAARAGLARADARQLGLGQPHVVHPHPAPSAGARRASRCAPATAARTRTWRSPRVLFAGLHGMREKLPLGEPVVGDAYTLDEPGEPLPASLEAALDALEADALLRDAMGPQIVDTFLAMKRFELDRHRQWVSDWEIAEYLHHL